MVLEKDYLIINRKKYFFSCSYCVPRKANNDCMPALTVVLEIQDEYGNYLEWEAFRGTYISEKISDYIKNTINGQRALYWDFSKPQVFREPQKKEKL